MRNAAMILVLSLLAGACNQECVEGSICDDDYANDTGSPGPEDFDITLVYVGDVTNRTRTAANAAARRLEELVVGDLEESFSFVDRPKKAGECWSDLSYDLPVDDVVIFVEEVEIDGKEGMAGRGGYCRRRPNGTSISGSVVIDKADTKWLSENEKLADVVAHEMVHVLGFGSGLDACLVRVSEDGESAEFVGEKALATVNSLTDPDFSGIPLSSDRAHWHRSLFSRELMEPVISMGSNPISTVTIMALADIGYEVDLILADSVKLTMHPDSGDENSTKLIW